MHIDLARARREAKALLAAARRGDRAALARIGAGAAPKLADAQRALARELGEPSWPRLVRRAEAEAVERGDRARRLVLEATDRRRDHAEALLTLDPGRTLDVALVLGDAGAVRAALATDPAVARRPLGARGWLPLRYVTHSAFLGGERTDGLLECARLLLAAGADPNAEAVLYGAAGIAHEPRMTALLLEAGADPDDGESLYHATEAADHACVKLLLAAGATVPGSNALAHTLDKEDPALVRLLLAHAPGPDEPWPANWPERERALRWAVWRGRSPEVVRLLAAAGSHLEWAGDGPPPYRLAVRMGRRDLAETLLELGARSALEPGDEHLGAAMRGEPDAARGELTREELAAALVDAAGDGRVEAIRALLRLGAPLDGRGTLGGTPLHQAAWMGSAPAVRVLLAHGADPHDLATETRSAPLAWAAHGSHAAPPGGDWVAVAELLLAAGAHPDAAIAREAEGELAAWLDAHLDDPGLPVGRWGELSHAAAVEWLRRLAAAPGAATRPVGDGFAVRTGSDTNTDNGVVCSRLEDESEIAAAIAFLGGAPGVWLTESTTEPPDLGRRLQQAGARTERTAVAMGARVADLRLRAPAAEVRDAGGGRALAWRDGRAAGEVAWTVMGDVVEVRHLYVRPEHRGRGVGRTLLAHAVRGAAEAVLSPTPDTIAYYERLGFTLERYPRERCFYLDRL